jgi:ABC-type transport system substrate-binding protein
MNNQRGKPTADRALRRAIVMALDRARLTRDLTYGAGVVATGDLPSFLWAFDPSLRNVPFDPAAARAALATRGFTAAHPLAMDLVYEQSQVVERSLAVQVAQELENVGIHVQTRPQLSSIIYGGYGAGGTLATGKYELALYEWTSGIDPDDSAQFMCRNRPPNGFNQSYYCSPRMDAAQEQALRSYDPATRKRAYATTETRLIDDAPVDVLWWPRYVQGLNPDLHGFDPNPVVETWDVANWSI